MQDSDSSFSSFPVDTVLPALAAALAGHGRAVLTAEPGSGKTTRIPLALLGMLPGQAVEKPAPGHAPLPGKILMLEPRRLAARAAARYMAKSLGEDVGQRVGYRVRLESRVSAQTRLELLTEGMFTRLLLADPALTGVSCVIFDEFHERSLQADLGLALCLEGAQVYRPDLQVLVMSATLDAGEIARFLGNCPVIAAKGRNWPVAVRHARSELHVHPGLPAREVAGRVVRAVREALHSDTGSILAFLPGQAEIRLCAEALAPLAQDTDVYPLYGDLPPAAQDAAIAPPPAGRRKVVLATDLAQTSLTIEGVRIVVDSGLARAPRFEPATGMSKLVTSRLADDAAVQRAGRAGRLESGLCIRLWPESEFLSAQTRPEIMEADLASLYLDALAWGSDPASLPFFTAPPEPALALAAETLCSLKAISFVPGANAPDSAVHTGGKRPVLTGHGQKLAAIPLHPRLAHMVLQAEAVAPKLTSLAACLAAIVSERDPLRKAKSEANSARSETDIRLRLPMLRRPENAWLVKAAKQIQHLAGLKTPFCLPGPEQEDYSGALLSLAWPERIAQRRENGSFRLASGQGAELAAHDPLAAEPLLAVASLGSPGGIGSIGSTGNIGGIGGAANRRIHLAAPLGPDDLERLHGQAMQHAEKVYWDPRHEEVRAYAAKHLGALVLEEKPIPASKELARQIHLALLEGVRAMGLACLPWTDEPEQLRARVLMLRKLEADGSDWPDLSDAALLAGLTPPPGQEDEEPATWLSPWLRGLSRKSQIGSIDLPAALQAQLAWPLPRRLEEEAPTRLPLPSGNTAKVDYLPVLRGEAPVLAVKLQEMFGQTDSPRLAKGRVVLMLHLLSPAGRPLQVTADLQHFWANGYKQVRAEMRGRYPKHPWPENPLTAIPTGKTKKKAGV